MNNKKVGGENERSPVDDLNSFLLILPFHFFFAHIYIQPAKNNNNNERTSSVSMNWALPPLIMAGRHWGGAPVP
jgi:hypothetical protein